MMDLSVSKNNSFWSHEKADKLSQDNVSRDEMSPRQNIQNKLRNANNEDNHKLMRFNFQ